MSTISTFGTCQICGLIQPKQGQCRDCNGIVKSGGIADPVPPAGGDVEVLARIDGMYGDPEAFAERELVACVKLEGLKIGTELVDRAHVTRLKAEKQTHIEYIGKLEQALNAAAGERDELKAEVERLELLVAQYDYNADAAAIEREIAGKGQGKPETYRPGLYAVRHIDNWDGERDVVLAFAQLDAEGNWTEKETGEALLTYRGDKILNAWPLDFQAPAEQPAPVEGLRSALDECIKQRDALKTAPVAVVMPERKPHRRGTAPIQNARNASWNACLDEVARLNPIKQ